MRYGAEGRWGLKLTIKFQNLNLFRPSRGNLSRHFATLEIVIDALDFNLDLDKRALNKTGSSWLVGTH